MPWVGLPQPWNVRMSSKDTWCLRRAPTLGKSGSFGVSSQFVSSHESVLVRQQSAHLLQMHLVYMGHIQSYIQYINPKGFVQVLDRFQNVANDLATGPWKQGDHQLAGLEQPRRFERLAADCSLTSLFIFPVFHSISVQGPNAAVFTSKEKWSNKLSMSQRLLLMPGQPVPLGFLEAARVAALGH